MAEPKQLKLQIRVTSSPLGGYVAWLDKGRGGRVRLELEANRGSGETETEAVLDLASEICRQLKKDGVFK